jgi:hypothetical protein
MMDGVVKQTTNVWRVSHYAFFFLTRFFLTAANGSTLRGLA